MPGVLKTGVSPPVLVWALWLLARTPMRLRPLPLVMTTILPSSPVIPAKAGIHRTRRPAPQSSTDLPDYAC
jgi:hypothetical protein